MKVLGGLGLNPKPETLNLKPETLNPQSETPNPKPLEQSAVEEFEVDEDAILRFAPAKWA